MAAELVAAPTLIIALQFLAFSALATDCLQSQHWIEGTREHPVPTPAGGWTYEVNPFVAGRPEALELCARLLAAGIEVAPRMLSPPFAALAIGAFAVEDVLTVLSNNRFAAEQGLPQYWMIAYRWRF